MATNNIMWECPECHSPDFIINSSSFRVCKACGIEDPVPAFDAPVCIESDQFQKRKATSEIVKNGKFKTEISLKGNVAMAYKLRKTQQRSMTRSERVNKVDIENKMFIQSVAATIGVGGASVKRAVQLYDEFVVQNQEMCHRTMNGLNKIVDIALLAFADDMLNAGANHRKFDAFLKEGLDVARSPRIASRFKPAYIAIKKFFHVSDRDEMIMLFKKHSITRFQEKIEKIVDHYKSKTKLEIALLAAAGVVYAVYGARIKRTATSRKYEQIIMKSLGLSCDEPEQYVARRNSVYLLRENAFYNDVFNDEFDATMRSVAEFLDAAGKENAKIVLDIASMESTSIEYIKRFVPKDAIDMLARSPVAATMNGKIAWSVYLPEIKRAIRDFIRPVDEKMEEPSGDTKIFCIGHREANRPSRDDRSLNMVVMKDGNEVYTHWMTVSDAKAIIKEIGQGMTVSAKEIKDQMIKAGMMNAGANPYRAYLVMSFLIENGFVKKNGKKFDVVASVDDILNAIDDLPVRDRNIVTKNRHKKTI